MNIRFKFNDRLLAYWCSKDQNFIDKLLNFLGSSKIEYNTSTDHIIEIMTIQLKPEAFDKVTDWRNTLYSL